MQEYDAALIERVAKTYEKRIKAFLERCRSVLIDAGWSTSVPYDMSDDEYRWSFEAVRQGEGAGPLNDEPRGEGSVGFTLAIAEAASYGDEPVNGVNFSLGIVEWGGRILGGLTPFNYTPQVWVDARDAAALEERWSLFEEADLSELAALVEGLSTGRVVTEVTKVEKGSLERRRT